MFLVGMCPIEKASADAFLQPHNVADARSFEDEVRAKRNHTHIKTQGLCFPCRLNPPLGRPSYCFCCRQPSDCMLVAMRALSTAAIFTALHALHDAVRCPLLVQLCSGLRVHVLALVSPQQCQTPSASVVACICLAGPARWHDGAARAGGGAERSPRQWRVQAGRHLQVRPRR